VMVGCWMVTGAKGSVLSNLRGSKRWLWLKKSCDRAAAFETKRNF